MSLISAFERERQASLCKFNASLVYIVSFQKIWSSSLKNLVKQNKTQTERTVRRCFGRYINLTLP